MNQYTEHDYTDEPNECRADWADYAINAFKTATRADDETVLCDLLNDLMHLCDRREGEEGWVFAQELESARSSYGEEITIDGGKCAKTNAKDAQRQIH